jgi:hypothetical protein
MLPSVAHGVVKCMVDGKVVYQDVPCKEDLETVGQDIQRKQHYVELERKLDALAAQGYGKMQQPRARPAEPPPGQDSGSHVPQPRSSLAREAEARRTDERLREQTVRKNAESAAALTSLLDKASQDCGGKLADYPAVGMTDEYFRLCTMHARFGGVTQVVVSEDGNLPLRLYIFPTNRASRVYSIGGVITAVKP